MNITGGANLSLYEVNEAADIVASASDPDVNMIFGAVINEELKDEIYVTVIATGFEHKAPAQHRSSTSNKDVGSKLDLRPFTGGGNDQLDIPTFLRNRRDNGDK